METLAEHVSLKIVTPDGRAHRASNGTLIQADASLDDLAAMTVRAVLIPGGDPGDILVPTPRATTALAQQHAAGALIAGICAGNLVMAAAGLLVGRRGTHTYTREYASQDQVDATAMYWAGMHYVRTDLVHDGNLITAQPWAYRKYATAVGRWLNVLSAEQAAAIESSATQSASGTQRSDVLWVGSSTDPGFS